jgi:predicted RNase H-like HicB family nuclease
LTGSERQHLSRPFEAGVLNRARALAEQYRLVIESDPSVGYVGSTIEMPLVMGDGRNIQACAKAVLEATTAAIATLLETGERPPAPARELRRDQQVNIRLSAEEKVRLEATAQREGYRSMSDYVRAAALRQSA